MNKIILFLLNFHPLMKIRYYFTDKSKTKKIPKGQYCYTSIYHNMETGTTFTKSCPYLKRHKRCFGLSKEKFNWCAYLNTGDEILLDDECKLCDENMGDENLDEE